MRRPFCECFTRIDQEVNCRVCQIRKDRTALSVRFNKGDRPVGIARDGLLLLCRPDTKGNSVVFEHWQSQLAKPADTRLTKLRKNRAIRLPVGLGNRTSEVATGPVSHRSHVVGAGNAVVQIKALAHWQKWGLIAQVPLADTGRGIARFMKQIGNRDLLGGKSRCGNREEYMRDGQGPLSA